MRGLIFLWAALGLSLSLESQTTPPGTPTQLSAQTAESAPPLRTGSTAVESKRETSSPIKVEVSQSSNPATFVDLAGNLAWPVFALVGLLLLHRPLGKFLTDIGKRASEISVGVLSLKLPMVSEVPIGNDVAAFKTMEGAQLANDSAKTTLFKEFRTAGYRQFLVIRLGGGQEWLTSRLFVFALMLQRMNGIRAIVFVDSMGGSELHYVGVSTPENVRWGLARRQPWLEAAFAAAYSSFTFLFNPGAPGQILITDFSGALSPDLAEDVVRAFVRNLLWTAAGTPNGPEWSQLGNSYEHATWVDTSTLRGILGEHLWSESIPVEHDDADKAKVLLRKRNPYVAVVDSRGVFQSLVDRVRLLQDMSERIG